LMFICSLGEDILTPFDDLHRREESESGLLTLEERCQELEKESRQSQELIRSLTIDSEYQIELQSQERDRLALVDPDLSLSNVQQKHLQKLQDRSEEILRGLRISLCEKSNRIVSLTEKLEALQILPSMVCHTALKT
jgi:flagellar basal body-associated protein FliL